MSAPSTTTAHVQPESSPGLDYLLVNAMELKDPARAELAAGNVLLPITTGIGAIGDLLADAAGSSGDPVSMKTIQEIGFLLVFLADAQGAMKNIIDCAHYDQLKAGRKEGHA